MRRHEKYSASDNYEVAIYKGEDIAFTGTVKEAAKHLGVYKRTILYHLTPTGRRRADRARKQHKVMRIVRL